MRTVVSEASTMQNPVQPARVFTKQLRTWDVETIHKGRGIDLEKNPSFCPFIDEAFSR